MGRSTDSIGRKPAIRHCFSGQFGVVDHGKHDALWAQIEGFLGPHGGRLREAEDGGSTGSGEGVEAREGVGDAAVAVFHVDHHEVVAGEAGDLGDGGGEAEEEEAVEGFAIFETGFEGLWGGGCGEIGSDGDGGGSKRGLGGAGF